MKIHVNASSEYDVTIGQNLLSSCGSRIAELSSARRTVIVTDDNVAPLYLEKVRESLDEAGIESFPIIIPHGEESKTLAVAGEILEFCAINRLSRSDIMIALGGGVVGDICGFAASVYLRGIPFLQLPTTLLAAVDSSVGGKTAVDLAAGKNLCGAFHQPCAVICDTDTFSTLTPKFYADGIAESIKYGVICDCELFERFENPALVRTNIDDIVARCVGIKRDIVSRDEFDLGERKLLNLGHTVAHAVEKLSSYTVTHGHAVAIGMSVIAYSSAAANLSDIKSAERIEAILRLNELPTRTSYSAKELWESATIDKKVEGTQITLVIPEEIGKSSLKKMSLEQLETFFADGLSLMEECKL